MNIINQAVTFAATGNTGFPRSIHEPGLDVGVILVPRGFFLTNTQLQTATSALAALTTALYAAHASRIFPIGRFYGIEDKNQDRQTETSNLGYTRNVRRGKIGRQYEIWNGGIMYQKQVFAFDGQHGDYEVYRIDDKNNLMGRKIKNASGDYEFYGYTLADLYVSDYTFPNGSAGGKFFVDLQYANSFELNESFGFINLGTDILTALPGLVNAELAKPAVQSVVNDVIRVKLMSDDGMTDLYDYLADAFAVVGAWKAADPATAAVVTISAVAKVAAQKAWALTITTNAPASGDPVEIDLNTPALLHALGTPINGIESSGPIQIDNP